MASFVKLEIIPNVERLSSRVIRILGQNPGMMTLQGTNTYIVGTGKQRVLIDTGEKNKPEYLAHLQKTLTDNSISVSHIVLTHWHHDHVGGLDGVLNMISKTNGSLPIVSKYPLASKDSISLSKDVTVNGLSDGDQIVTEGASLKVVFTPGHTEDHIALFLEEENAIFSGDCVLGQGTAVFESLFHYMHSLKKLLSYNPSTVYPGHGPVLCDGVAAIAGYIKHRHMREEQILNHLKVGSSMEFQTARQIVEVLYKDVGEHLWPAAELNVKHHLSKLKEEGKAECRTEGSDEIWSLSKNKSNY